MGFPNWFPGGAPRGAAEAPPRLCLGGQEPRAPCGAGGAQRMLRPRRAQLVALQRASTAGEEGDGAGAENCGTGIKK